MRKEKGPDCATCAQKDGGGWRGHRWAQTASSGLAGPGLVDIRTRRWSPAPRPAACRGEVSVLVCEARGVGISDPQLNMSVPLSVPEGCAQAGRSEGAGRVNLTLKTESSGMFSSTAWRPVSAGRGDEYRQTAAFSAVPAGPVAGRCDDSQCRGRSAKSGSPWLTLLPPSSHLRRDRDLWRFSRCPKRILFIIPLQARGHGVDPCGLGLAPAGGVDSGVWD